MKAFNRTLFTVFILLPCLILGYQNCADLSSQDVIEPTSDGNVEGSSEASKQAPVFVNDLSLIGYSKPSDCSADSIQTMTVYNSTTNICAEVSDSCQAYHLIKEGYSEDQTDVCKDVDSPDDESFKESLSDISAEAAGFKAQPGQICSMQFSEMISFKTRECAAAANGCEISYYASQGFVKDSFGLCR